MPIIHKKPNLIIYINGYFQFFNQFKGFKDKIKILEKKLTKKELENVEQRVEYYNKLTLPIDRSNFSKRIYDLRKITTPKAYYFDTYEYARFFPKQTPINYLFGDITQVPEISSIVKSRPIGQNNQNSVLLNLDKARHFVWVENDKPFREKKDILIGRCAVYQNHRYQFYKKHFDNPLCDLGHVGKEVHPNWIKPKMNIIQHLDYKFILSLQGNDVATNLKWVMSSNSLAVMPKPTIETWFMEGTIMPGAHYVPMDENYDNLTDQLNYYMKNPDECEQIIKNSHMHWAQFKNQDKEDLIALLVLKKFLID